MSGIVLKSEIPAVIAGLAVGIALIVTFALNANSVFTLSDEEIIQKASSLPEVQAFYKRAGNSHVSESVRHQGNNILVTFAESRTWGYEDPNGQTDPFTVRKTLKLSLAVNESGETKMGLSCLGPVSGNEIPTVESIRYSTCFEPSADDFVGRNSTYVR